MKPLESGLTAIHDSANHGAIVGGVVGGVTGIFGGVTTLIGIPQLQSDRRAGRDLPL
jgi:hypothetical protein